MAKIGFTKLAPIKSIEAKTIQINGQDVIIQQYLPIQKKSELFEKIVAEVLDLKGIVSPLRKDIYVTIFIVAFYSNINLTDTMINNAAQTYDLLKINGVAQAVYDAIPVEELTFVLHTVDKTLDSYSRYQSSALGVFDIIKDAQGAESDNVKDLMQQVQSLSEDATLNEVLQKLG